MPWLVDGMVKLLTDKNDSVYKYYFEETNSVYIGRTLMRRQNDRDREHIFSNTDTVHIHAKENGLAVPPMEIIEENITPIEALEREDYWVKYYKEKGYNVLNIAKTGIGIGSLGSIGGWKWNKESVFEESRKYDFLIDFERNSPSAYNIAYKNDWIKNMPWLKLTRKNNNYWENDENVIEESKKYSSKINFQNGNKYAYRIAWKKKLFDKMPWLKKEDNIIRKDSKTVLQIDINTNNIINEFPRIIDAAKSIGIHLGSNIAACCNGKRRKAYGYKWSFK